LARERENIRPDIPDCDAPTRRRRVARWKSNEEMTMTVKLKSGERLPDVIAPRLGGGKQMVAVYREKHCPICRTYLAEIERTAPEFAKAGVGIIAVSGDPEDRARAFTDEIDLRQILNISNAPFARADLAGLTNGLTFIRDNDCPIRDQSAA
jgi:hypothetical protein